MWLKDRSNQGTQMLSSKSPLHPQLLLLLERAGPALLSLA